ncbi:MAG: hypothetical protein ACK443_08375 [Methylococcaceae bacterium]|jgi:D-glycerate 3-kinase
MSIKARHLAPGWPESLLSEAEFSRLWQTIRPRFLDLMRQHQIPNTQATELAALYLPLAAWVNSRLNGTPLVMGINGAQGSGNTTLTDFLGVILTQLFGKRVAGFSIDDLYRTRNERKILAETIHPLLLTRGVPGTHDVALGLSTLSKLKAATSATLTPIPSFDKSTDDRLPSLEWRQFRGRPDIILFEGWCVGAMPQLDQALTLPVNELESQEDPSGVWRHFVNEQLKGPYATLFAEIDYQLVLKVPSMDSVFEWRSLQETKLAAQRSNDGTALQLMDPPGIRRFIMHYERLTRHMLQEMPDRADLVLHLSDTHRCTRIACRPKPG